MKLGLYRKDFCFMLVRTVIFASIAAALATQVPSFFAGTGQQTADLLSANYVSTEDGKPAVPARPTAAIRSAFRQMRRVTIPAASRSTASRCKA